MDKQHILKEYFGHRAFRSHQEQLIDRLLAGEDVVGIMPTGAGKSVCYQVPALMLPGITLVISPLISLMRDQVLALKSAGIPAAYINSTLTPAQRALVYRRGQAGSYKIIYVSPERLEGEEFLAFIRSISISLVAVDEAHCVSQWGQDFRPSYLKIAQFLAVLPHRPPVGAFTATATKAVRRDIEQLLGLKKPTVLVTGFDRPNLYFDVISLSASQKPAALQQLLKERPGRSGIVYCSTRSAVERVHADLICAGFSAGRYHAGLEEEERRQSQADFQYDRTQIMVATNAFGMGIDKSNVNFVIHYNMPLSLEAYYQEAGRAGRDGSRSSCILLFAPGDVKTAQFLIDCSMDNSDLSPAEAEAHHQRELQRLGAMERYCKTPNCLRQYILDYFGEKHGENCGNCGCCLRRYGEQEITLEAKMILSCAVRAEKQAGAPCPADTLADILYGSSQTVESLRGLTTFGLMGNYSMAKIMEYLSHLEGEDFLSPVEGGLTVSDKGRAVLFQGEQVWMRVEQSGSEGKKPRRGGELDEGQQKLFETLKALRAKLARRAGVPPYALFSDASLEEMAVRRPQSMDDLLDIAGVGEQKARRYGRALLDTIQVFDIG